MVNAFYNTYNNGEGLILQGGFNCSCFLSINSYTQNLYVHHINMYCILLQKIMMCTYIQISGITAFPRVKYEADLEYLEVRRI